MFIMDFVAIFYHFCTKSYKLNIIMRKQTLHMYIIPWVVSVVVGDERCGEPAADEKYYCQHGRHTKVTASQRHVLLAAIVA